MTSRYPILQSGFIAANDKVVSQHKTETDIVADYILSKTHLKSINNYHFSKDITKLYKAWKSDRNILNKFDFRELVLIEAKQSFAFLTGPSFQKWLQLQVDQNMVTDLHMAFLNETVAFIFGDTRHLSVHQWFSLLEAKESNNHANTALNLTNPKIDNTALYSIETILQLWVSRKEGFEDLLATLNVIFGERTAITNASYKHSG